MASLPFQWVWFQPIRSALLGLSPKRWLKIAIDRSPKIAVSTCTVKFFCIEGLGMFGPKFAKHSLSSWLELQRFVGAKDEKLNGKYVRWVAQRSSARFSLRTLRGSYGYGWFWLCLKIEEPLKLNPVIYHCFPHWNAMSMGSLLHFQREPPHEVMSHGCPSLKGV